LTCSSIFYAQGKTDYQVVAVGFYNLENLFDTSDDPLINDEEFLPDGERAWNNEKYQEKLGNMAYVISKMGTDLSPQGVSVLGVSEIENKKVLEDLVAHPILKEKDFGIIHYDSPDKRGIDVALLYQKGHFTPEESDHHPVYIYKGEERKFTRDILYVRGKLAGDDISFMVNHWPSRSGGEARSAPFRKAAAKKVKAIQDSIETIRPNSKLIIMGDLNDDPTSESVKSVLKAKKNVSEVKPSGLFNPMEEFYTKGIGSNAWSDSWSLFDQVIVSEALLDKKQEGLFYYQAQIFNKKFLTQKSGQYKGYPFRTFAGGSYKGGYSDHFPVFVYLLKSL